MAVFSAVLFGGRVDRLFEAVSFVCAARARGDQALLFLRGPALRCHVENQWGASESGVEESALTFQHKTPTEFLEECRQQGGVSVYACSAWMQLLALSPSRVADRVDAVIGLNAFLSQAQGGPILTF